MLSGVQTSDKDAKLEDEACLKSMLRLYSRMLDACTRAACPERVILRLRPEPVLSAVAVGLRLG